VLLRVNPPCGSSAGARRLLVMGGGPSPFGMDIVLVDRCAAMFAGLGSLRLRGLQAFGLAGAYAWNISHHSFLMHPPPGFHYLA
jgi:hypothetical protein